MDVIDLLQIARRLFQDNWNTLDELCSRLSNICLMIMDNSSVLGAAKTLADIFFLLLQEAPIIPSSGEALAREVGVEFDMFEPIV